MTGLTLRAAGIEHRHDFSAPENVAQPWRERFLKMKKAEMALITARSRPVAKR